MFDLVFLLESEEEVAIIDDVANVVDVILLFGLVEDYFKEGLFIWHALDG